MRTTFNENRNDSRLNVIFVNTQTRFNKPQTRYSIHSTIKIVRRYVCVYFTTKRDEDTTLLIFCNIDTAILVHGNSVKKEIVLSR